MKKQFLFAALAAFSASGVMAGDLFGSSDASEGGGTVYGGVSLGQTAADCGTSDCKGSNWKMYGGYDVTSNIAIEGAYHSIIKTDDAKVTGLSAAGLYSMPVADNLKAFGKAGAIAWDSDGTANGTDILLGAGATYKIDDNWGVRGEYEHVGGDLKANMYSVGAVFSTL